MTNNQPLQEVLLLIPCCGSKKGTSPRPQITSASLHDELSLTSIALLDEGRQLTFSRAPNVIDLSSPLLPAVAWYTDKPYCVPGFRQSLDTALRLGVRCLIVSAGYGLLRPDDPIHKYDLKMRQTLGIWRQRLPRILADYVRRNGIRRMFGVLSAKYYEAVAQAENLLADVDVKWFIPSFARGVESGAALTVVPEKVAHGVIDLIDSGFNPGPSWCGEPTPLYGSSRELSAGIMASIHRDIAALKTTKSSGPRATMAGAASPNAEDFRARLDLLLDEADSVGQTYSILTASDLHRQVGGYPGLNHRMANCCQVMLGRMQPGDQILEAPPSGKGASLTIRYRLPRKQAL